MDKTQELNRKYSSTGWGLLLMIWGVTLLFDFIPFGFGLLATGLLLLGMNAMRSINNLPTHGDNIVLGILAFVWGGLELARPILGSLFEFADLDWVIFAILLIVLGGILITRAWLSIRTTRIQNTR